MTTAQLTRLVRAAGREPLERDTLYNIVNIPPMGSKEAADKKVAELRGLGVTNYFVMSQQTNTRFWLYADGRRARGLLLQQLPADRIRDLEERDASWQHVTALASTLSADELLGLDATT